jgi:hypothetical protein
MTNRLITFSNGTNEFEVLARDNAPALGEDKLNIEGRWIIDVTVESFIELVAASGYEPVRSGRNIDDSVLRNG